jgi:hypothetical protein
VSHSILQRCNQLSRNQLNRLQRSRILPGLALGAALLLARPVAAQALDAPAATPAPRAPTAAQRMVNPHGNKQTMARVIPAPDLPAGDIEIRLSSNEANLLDNQDIKLGISKQSIEQGNTSSELHEKTNLGGIVRFHGQPTGTDFVYTVSASVGGAQFSAPQFQFRAGAAGMRVLLPVYKATSDANQMLLLSRSLFAIIPQDNLFAVDMLWRVENYSDTAWVPDPADKNLRYDLPEGAKALNIRTDQGSDARFVDDGNGGIRLGGTFGPGQHDLMLRFHLSAENSSTREIKFPSALHLGSARILLDSAPGMTMKIEGFEEPTESRNQDGQRRLIAARDFLGEKIRAPEAIKVQISGIPTPAAGRGFAVTLAAVIAMGGLVLSMGRFKTRTPTRSQLSKEDRERAGELLLEELIRLEQAFKQGEIGRKTHDTAKRQLLEAYARLGAGVQAA